MQTEPEKPDAPSSREKIILQAQELLDKQGLVVSEEYLNDAFEELGSETPKPEELADHTRSMLERDEAEPPWSRNRQSALSGIFMSNSSPWS